MYCDLILFDLNFGDNKYVFFDSVISISDIEFLKKILEIGKAK
jgi:hypothetical protein